MLYVVLVGWLMLHGYLDMAVLIVLLALVGMVGARPWAVARRAPPRAAVLASRRRASWRPPGGTATT